MRGAADPGDLVAPCSPAAAMVFWLSRYHLPVVTGSVFPPSWGDRHRPVTATSLAVRSAFSRRGGVVHADCRREVGRPSAALRRAIATLQCAQHHRPDARDRSDSTSKMHPSSRPVGCACAESPFRCPSTGVVGSKPHRAAAGNRQGAVRRRQKLASPPRPGGPARSGRACFRSTAKLWAGGAECHQAVRSGTPRRRKTSSYRAGGPVAPRSALRLRRNKTSIEELLRHLASHAAGISAAAGARSSAGASCARIPRRAAQPPRGGDPGAPQYAEGVRRSRVLLAVGAT